MQQPRPVLPTVSLTWHARKYQVYKLNSQNMYLCWSLRTSEDVHLVKLSTLYLLARQVEEYVSK